MDLLPSDLPPSSVIMQPTTLCNLTCSYCYLPNRRHVRRMLPAVAQAVAASMAPWTARTTVEMCWHGGEPLTAGRAYLGRLMDRFVGLDVAHGLQTNATLVDEAWVDFLAERNIHVGVSIDGPPEDNQQRADWAGRSAFDRIVRGIRLLVGREMTDTLHVIVGPYAAAPLAAALTQLLNPPVTTTPQEVARGRGPCSSGFFGVVGAHHGEHDPRRYAAVLTSRSRSSATPALVCRGSRAVFSTRNRS